MVSAARSRESEEILRKLILLAAVSSAPASGQSGPTSVTLHAGDEPETRAWTQPATIAYTSRKDDKDSWSLDAALKIQFQPSSTSPNTFFIRGAVQKNTQQKKEAENFNGKVGYSFDFDTAGHDENSDTPNLSAWYFFGDASLGINHKTIFADPKAVCTAIPLPAECGKQRETSLRGTLSLMPFHSSWEETIHFDPESAKWTGPAFTHSFLPVFALFHDEVIDAKVNASGVKPDGGATGGKVEVKAAASPRFTDYRLILSLTGQHVQAFSRSERRRDTFEKSSTLITVAADYEFGIRSFEEDRSGFIPAFGVSYSKGDDPLSGKIDQDNVVVGLKLTYRSQ